jgi:hypothetical protein
MPAKSFLRRLNGLTTLVFGVQSSAGAANAGDIPALDETGRIDNSMMPVGIGADTASIPATENLAAGALVNVYNSTGQKVRNADGTTAGKECTGFVLAAVTSGANATVYFEGTITGLTGLTPGARYYLATTPGGVTATPLAATGNVDQLVGVAISTTSISFEPGEPVYL